MNFIIDLSTLPKEFAYLDPGSGSILIQLLIGTAMGALFLVKVYWNKLKGLFSGKKEQPDSPDFLVDNDNDPKDED
jgi:hypothetical protein